MDWIYFSPHLDDVALSCGGLVWEQARVGHHVAVWTVCAGDPPEGELSDFAQSLHDRWQTGAEAMAVRREEDIRSCTVMGADYRHLEVPDCIYRRGGPANQPLYDSEAALFSPVSSYETSLVAGMQRKLKREVPDKVQIVCPLSLGGHVDHRLTKAVVEGMRPTSQDGGSHVVWYYQDYPYAQQQGDWLDPRQGDGWQSVIFPISLPGMRAWGDAVAAHRSQISTFWPDLAGMREALREYARQEGGVRLWRRQELN